MKTSKAERRKLARCTSTMGQGMWSATVRPPSYVNLLRRTLKGTSDALFSGKDFKNRHLARWAVEGVRLSIVDDFTWSCITSPWWMLLFLVVATYMTLALLFAVVLTTLAGKGALEGDLPEGMAWFEGCFWFSLTNLLTGGFGKLTPASRFGHGIAAILQLVGMLLSALLLGFVVTQAMTPQAKILMSKVGIMRWVDGKQQLVLRGGNVRGVFLAMPELRLCYVHEVTMLGCTYFMEEPLPLPPKVALHPGFEVIYDIQPGDYLNGKTKDDMIAEKGFFGLVITGMDEYTCQTVQTIEAVFAANIFWNARFEDFRTPQNGIALKRDEYRVMKTVNFNKLEGIALLPPHAWPSHLPPLPNDQSDDMLLRDLARCDLGEQLRQGPSEDPPESRRPTSDTSGPMRFWDKDSTYQAGVPHEMRVNLSPVHKAIPEEAEQLQSLKARGWSIESAGYSPAIYSSNLRAMLSPPAVHPDSPFQAATTAAMHTSFKDAVLRKGNREPFRSRLGWRDFLRRKRSSEKPAASKSRSNPEDRQCDDQDLSSLLARRTCQSSGQDSLRSAMSESLDESTDAVSVQRSMLSAPEGKLPQSSILAAKNGTAFKEGKHVGPMQSGKTRPLKQADRAYLGTAGKVSVPSSNLAKDDNNAAEQFLWSGTRLTDILPETCGSTAAGKQNAPVNKAAESPMLPKRMQGGGHASLHNRLNNILTLNIGTSFGKGARLRSARSS